MKPINIDKFRKFYSINEYGVVYSNRKNRYMTGAVNSVGYKMVFLTDIQGNNRWYMLSRLVALTYIGHPDNIKLEANHRTTPIHLYGSNMYRCSFVTGVTVV